MSKTKCDFITKPKNHIQQIGFGIWKQCNIVVPEEQASKTLKNFGQILCMEHEEKVKKEIDTFSGWINYLNSFLRKI